MHMTYTSINHNLTIYFYSLVIHRSHLNLNKLMVTNSHTWSRLIWAHRSYNIFSWKFRFLRGNHRPGREVFLVFEVDDIYSLCRAKSRKQPKTIWGWAGPSSAANWELAVIGLRFVASYWLLTHEMILQLSIIQLPTTSLWPFTHYHPNLSWGTKNYPPDFLPAIYLPYMWSISSWISTFPGGWGW